jgi:hypothetical protein
MVNRLNETPCEYGHINNIDAFSRDFCEATIKNEPDMTVHQLLHLMDDCVPATLEHVAELNREMERREILRTTPRSGTTQD